MASDASISGKGWVWSLKIAFQGDKKFASCTLCLKNPVICFQNLASKKVNHWGEKAHQVPQQSRKEQLLRKSLEREEASGWAKRMTVSLVPTAVCSSWSFCSPAVKRMKLPLGSHRQHSTQTMAWLAHYCTFCIHLRIPVFSTMCKALLFTGAVLKAQV